jgi:molecular chaperone Hsp33
MPDVSDPLQPAPPDRPALVLRALTSDRHVRLGVLDASPLWDGIRRSHPHLEPEACACLTELMASAALLQSRTVFVERLQILLKGAGRAKAVVADSWPDGMVRGMLDVSDVAPGSPWVDGPGIFQVMRSSASGEPYIGNLELVAGGVQSQIEAYLLQSEQVQASATLWCDSDTSEAGALLVEPLPNCPPERLARLIQALEGLEVVPFWERKPEFLVDWINQGPGAQVLSETLLSYGCRCSKQSLLGSLRGFAEAQREELFAEGGPIEVRCDYCGTIYWISKEELLA